MRRRLLIALALAVALLFLFPVVGTASAEDHDNASTEPDAEIEPGQQLSGLLSIQDAEMAGDLEQKTVETELERADDSEAEKVVKDRLADVEAELATLEQRKQSLEERLAAGQISRSTYAVQMAELSVKTDAHAAIAETAVETGMGSSQDDGAQSVALNEDLETSLADLGRLTVVNISFEEGSDGIDLHTDREDMTRSALSADLADPGDPVAVDDSPTAQEDGSSDDSGTDDHEDTAEPVEEDVATGDDVEGDDQPRYIDLPDNFTVADLPEKYQEILPEEFEIPDKLPLSMIPEAYRDVIPDEWDGEVPDNFSFEDIPEEYRERLWQELTGSDWVDDGDGTVEDDTDDGG